MAQTKAQLLGPALGDVMDFDNNTFYIDGANNRVGILKNNPTSALEVNGEIKSTELTTTGNLNGAQGHFTDHIYIADTICHTGDTLSLIHI